MSGANTEAGLPLDAAVAKCASLALACGSGGGIGTGSNGLQSSAFPGTPSLPAPFHCGNGCAHLSATERYGWRRQMPRSAPPLPWNIAPTSGLPPPHRDTPSGSTNVQMAGRAGRSAPLPLKRFVYYFDDSSSSRERATEVTTAAAVVAIAVQRGDM